MLSYALVLGLAAFGLYGQWSYRMATILRLADESLQATAKSIDATAKSANDHVALLRVEAERALLHDSSGPPHPVRAALVRSPDGATYGLKGEPPVPTELAAYLVGGGDLNTLPVETTQEIEAALHLIPLFRRVTQNIPQASWVYYTSANRFVSIYPLENQWDFLHWNDDMLTHPVFVDTAPPNNPQRLVRWSKAYVDQAGKGLMASVTAPVSDASGRFRGMVALDITLTTLNDYLSGSGLDIGKPFLANQYGQLIAHPELVRPGNDTLREVDAALPEPIAQNIAGLLPATKGTYTPIDGWLLHTVELEHAPWTAFHLIRLAELRWRVLSGMYIEFATLLLVLLIVILLEQRRRAAQRLRIFRAALNASTSGVLITDADASIRYVNPGFEAITGYSRKEVRGRSPSILKSGRTPPSVYASLWEAVATGKSWQGELLNRRKNGELYWSDLRISRVRAQRGEPPYLVGLMNDISERKRAEQALLDSETYTKTLFERSFIPQAIVDPQTRRFVDCNDAAVAIYGCKDRDELIGRSPLDFVVSVQADGTPSEELAQRRLSECLAAGSLLMEWHNRRPDGEMWDAEVRCTSFRHRDRTLIQLSLQDVTERKRLITQMSKAMVVFDASTQGIMTTDAAGVITSVNPAFTEITGYAADEAIGKTPAILRSGKHDRAFYEQMWQALATAGRWESEIWNRRKNGEIYPQWQSISTVRDERGQIAAYISLFNDITLRKQQDEAIWRQANFDALTGLANRSLLADRLDHALAHARRTHTQVGVLFLDLDGFKWINDTLGHDVGDELLIEVAHRLTSCVRDQDTVARLGGDEFTIVVQDLLHADDLHAVGEKVVNILREPFKLGTIAHRISGSVGITVYPDDGDNVQTLFRNADIAMYKSKQAGKNRLQFYSRDMQTDALARMQLEADLRVALDQHSLKLHYQPIVDADSGELVGAEALIRWDHPERGAVSPLEFVPVAEDSGLIIAIGEWALREAARQARRWRDLGYPSLRLAVNMSGVQFREASLPGLVGDVLHEYGLDRDSLLVEITESVLMGGSETIETRMRAIKALGIGYALDDFGTGFSSLSYLKRFPVDIVKIDRSFISGCPDDRNDAHLVEAIVTMAHSLDLRVTAEGVETEQQVSFLRDLGCDYLQGYFISRPVAAQEFEVLLGRHFLLPAVDGASLEETRFLTALRHDDLDIEDWLRRLLGERSPQLATFLTRGHWTRNGLDLKNAIQSHLDWRKRLNEYVAGRPSAMAVDIDDASSIHRCPLGGWIERNAGIPDDRLQRLDRVHREFHMLAGQIVADFEQGYRSSARRTLTGLKFRTASRNVVVTLIDCFDDPTDVQNDAA
ncbi:MAG TPA: EAL domain-containing protein [Aromatoleum sp.]|uniref:EAL domain-containing protein n=1 Tax=Aromatoleum sp. TaxID=2307007 RepID=UPI002B472C8A|nr:EAL domain-containing protein [Aromatoleum sp.]HJV25244.1 EAL domain-containing protein [Aromatoleum sp.]